MVCHFPALPPTVRSAIYLLRPGTSVRVRSWTPDEHHYHGFLITHEESIAIAEYYTVPREGDCGLSPLYRPTVHYAYHPCDEAVISIHELVGNNYKKQSQQRLMKDEIVHGTDTKLFGVPVGRWYSPALTSFIASISQAWTNSVSSLLGTHATRTGTALS